MQYFQYYVLAPIFLVVMLVFLGLFLSRLHDPIIAARGWKFSTLIAVSGMFHISIVTFELAVTENSDLNLSCHFLLWSSILFVPLFYNVMAPLHPPPPFFHSF